MLVSPQINVKINERKMKENLRFVRHIIPSLIKLISKSNKECERLTDEYF